MFAVLLWTAFVVLFALSRLRLFQTSGERDRIALILYALGAVVALLTGFFVGWIACAVMAAGWLILPFVTDPLVERFAGPPPTQDGLGGSPSEQAQRMARLRRGEMSLGDYFKEGHEDDAEARRRLEALAARRDIGSVLTKYRVSPARFVDLRERLARVREREWEILGDARDLERLIDLVRKSKSDEEIGNAFRARRKGAS